MIGEELFISAGDQISLFLSACLAGVRIAAFYECFRLVRCLFNHGETVVALEDVLFCIMAAIYSFNFWLCSAKGELRGFILVGEWIGAAAYFFTIGRLVSRAERLLSGWIHTVFLRLSRPIKRAGKAFVTRKNNCVNLICITLNLKIKKIFFRQKKGVPRKLEKITIKKRKITHKTS